MQFDLITDLNIPNEHDMCKKCLLNYNYNEFTESDSCNEHHCIYSDDEEQYNTDILETLFKKGGFTLYHKYATKYNIHLDNIDLFNLCIETPNHIVDFKQVILYIRDNDGDIFDSGLITKCGINFLKILIENNFDINTPFKNQIYNKTKTNSLLIDRIYIILQYSHLSFKTDDIFNFLIKNGGNINTDGLYTKIYGIQYENVNHRMLKIKYLVDNKYLSHVDRLLSNNKQLSDTRLGHILKQYYMCIILCDNCGDRTFDFDMVSLNKDIPNYPESSMSYCMNCWKNDKDGFMCEKCNTDVIGYLCNKNLHTDNYISVCFNCKCNSCEYC